MANIKQVAKYILEHLGSMTTMKLEKLCYYCQAWTLAWDEAPLFDEDFQAWANGPVCPDLYCLHKEKFTVSEADIPDSCSSLTEVQTENIDKVLEYYGSKEPHWLSELTHKERPWKETRERSGALPGDSCDSIIPKALMQEYYAGISV